MNSLDFPNIDWKYWGTKGLYFNTAGSKQPLRDNVLVQFGIKGTAWRSKVYTTTEQALAGYEEIATKRPRLIEKIVTIFGEF